MCWSRGSRRTWLGGALDQAIAACSEIRGRRGNILLVGGTPLYLKAVLQGIFAGPSAVQEVRQRLQEEGETVGSVALHRRLACCDPTTASRLHPNDLRRIIRALEVYESTGRPISAWQSQWSAATAAEAADSVGNRCLWLTCREELYERINQRVQDMFAAGLVEEVRALRALRDR